MLHGSARTSRRRRATSRLPFGSTNGTSNCPARCTRPCLRSRSAQCRRPRAVTLERQADRSRDSYATLHGLAHRPITPSYPPARQRPHRGPRPSQYRHPRGQNWRPDTHTPGCARPTHLRNLAIPAPRQRPRPPTAMATGHIPCVPAPRNRAGRPRQQSQRHPCLAQPGSVPGEHLWRAPTGRAHQLVVVHAG